jgi:acyl-coenzyme A synthetase/AMP-(fatty) acid ligase
MFLNAFDRAEFAERTAIIFGSRKVTYGQVAARAADIAGYLQLLGVSQGDRVGLHFRNSDDFVASYLACYWIGAVAAPLRYNQSADFIISYCNDLGVKCVMADDRLVDKVASRSTELISTRIVVTPQGMTIDKTKYRRVAHDGEPLLILHTSGSTARPKGVMQSLHALTGRTHALIECMSFRADDVVCVVADLSHGFGLHNLVAPAFALGAAVMIFDQMESDASLIILEASRAGATVLGANPTNLRRLLRAANDASVLPKLRFAMSSADKLPDDVALQWQETFATPVLEGWGMGEACGCALLNRPDDNEIGTVGRPLPAVQARIVTDGRDVADGEIGELWLAGDFFSGYWNDAGATRHAFSDGWLKTGDQFTRDQIGRFRYVGREWHVIKHGGVKISPFEIESALMRHPAIAQCVAIGVPSDEWGQDIEVFVTLRFAVSAGELRLHATKALSPVGRPAKYWSVSAIPETAAGKMARNTKDYADAGAKPLPE